MNQRIHFLHHSPGRVRVSIDGLKGNVQLRDALERLAGEVKGVRQITASTVTGSVLIHYDPADSGAFARLRALMEEAESLLDLLPAGLDAVRERLYFLGLAP